MVKYKDAKTELVKLDVYNVRKYVEKTFAGSTTFGYHGEYAVVISDRQDLVFCSEGVGQCVNTDDTFKIPLDKLRVDGDRAVSIFPVAEMAITVCELVSKCECREVYIEDFIRKFGDRLESNFKIMLRGINEIGCDSSDYHNGFER